eukprot:CAMPEP_0175163976 /NCGR_PEP_ID=MMETSP0087-20121206/26107_1 /TAXON_ID=136419 /ORGANISM="Unknown Unknown, Strain D1" /LENGTH=53 /DNA_ID=CAMNT_0016452857 /DNA_START=508 /DNA_END=669 /DNA_ORIENTATION=-
MVGDVCAPLKAIFALGTHTPVKRQITELAATMETLKVNPHACLMLKMMQPDIK